MRSTPPQADSRPTSSTAVELSAAGLTLGTKTLLMRFEPGRQRLAIDADRERCLALLSVACRRPLPPEMVRHLKAASAHWHRGEPALANLRLVFARLPRLEDRSDAARVLAAEYLLDAGMAPRTLLKEANLDPDAPGLRKYDPNEPRVPAGQGDKSGEWTAGFWSRVRQWLEQQVPVYDQDTGIEVGTQSRARSIATDPLAVGAVGAAALLGGEAIAGAAIEAEAPAAVEVEELTPFAQRYLSTSGGRLGGTATRRQLYEISQEYADTGQYVRLQGDGQGPEEYIPGPGPGTKGSTYVDFTAKSADGTAIRVQTIDTLSDGVTPTKAEADAAARITSAYPNDKLFLIPKWPK